MNTQASYQDILKSKYSERCQKNARYSLRAYARDLGISPQRLSHIMNGKHGLSIEAAQEITKNLNLDENEAKFFCTLVQEKHARSKVMKKKATEDLKSIKSQYKDLSLDHFKIIADWYHFAIMELTLLEGFQSDFAWMAKSLGIGIVEVKIAVERLLKLELLVENDGQLSISGSFFADPRGTPSEALRLFHRQLMVKASQALEFQSQEERDFSSTILAVDQKDLPRAKDVIKDFRNSFDQEFGKSQTKNNVYCLGIQFFSLHEHRSLK